MKKFVEENFAPLKTEYRHYLLAKGFVNGSYSATIGYDREEKYQEYDQSLRKIVTKTRTVTDWQPFSGTHNYETIGAVSSETNAQTSAPGDYLSNCLQKSITYNEKKSEAPLPLAPTDASIDGVQQNIFDIAECNCSANLPGDHHKDFNYSGTVSLSKVECHVAPQYVLNFKYLNDSYTVYAHSVNGSQLQGNMPNCKSQIIEEIENNKKVKYLNIFTFISLLFSIFSSIVLPVACKIIFGIIGIVSFIVLTTIRAITTKNVYSEKRKMKINLIINLLSKKGIEVPNSIKEEL